MDVSALALDMTNFATYIDTTNARRRSRSGARPSRNDPTCDWSGWVGLGADGPMHRSRHHRAPIRCRRFQCATNDSIALLRAFTELNVPHRISFRVMTGVPDLDLVHPRRTRGSEVEIFSAYTMARGYPSSRSKPPSNRGSSTEPGAGHTGSPTLTSMWNRSRDRSREQGIVTRTPLYSSSSRITRGLAVSWSNTSPSSRSAVAMVRTTLSI